ncbi:MAG: HPr family phosphocarrier protein [Lachnospiraceae bacterium]|nr:HPr family phosphocarrier protein [Lachnospiraceae bacterium]
MVAQKIVVAKISGLHLRPAGKISETCLQYACKIQIKKGDCVANAKSVLGLLAARVRQGDEIEIICDGADEQKALQAVIEVIQSDK